MHLYRLPIALATLTALPACAPQDGGQVGEITIACQPVETQALSVSETSPLGFSAMDVLDLVEGSHTAPIRWANGSESELTVTYAFEGTANFQVRAWVDEMHGETAPAPAVGADCPDIVELAMSVSVSSTDGALDESWTVDLQVANISTAILYNELGAPQGSLDIASFAPMGDFDSYRAHATVTIEAAGITGTIDGQASGTDGEAAFASDYSIAEFGLLPE